MIRKLVMAPSQESTAGESTARASTARAEATHPCDARPGAGTMPHGRYHIFAIPSGQDRSVVRFDLDGQQEGINAVELIIREDFVPRRHALGGPPLVHRRPEFLSHLVAVTVTQQ